MAVTNLQQVGPVRRNVGTDETTAVVLSNSEPALVKKLIQTTNYSLSAAAPERPERRSGERYVSLLRVGALVIEGRRELCLIRNVSAGGMMKRRRT